MHVHFQINSLSICSLLPTSFAILITISNYFVHKSPGLKFEFTSGHETEQVHFLQAILLFQNTLTFCILKKMKDVNTRKKRTDESKKKFNSHLFLAL